MEMEIEQRKSLQVIAREIIERRASYFPRPLDPDALRFAEDAAVEALHTNDAYIKWYGEAQALKERVRAYENGSAEKHLQDQLATALQQVQALRGQLVALSKFTGVTPKADYSDTPVAPVKPKGPAIGILFAAMLAIASPALAEVRDPVTTVCPDGTIMQLRHAYLKRDRHGNIATDEVGMMKAAVDVACKRIMPQIAPKSAPEVIEWTIR